MRDFVRSCPFDHSQKEWKWMAGLRNGFVEESTCAGITESLEDCDFAKRHGVSACLAAGISGGQFVRCALCDIASTFLDFRRFPRTTRQPVHILVMKQLSGSRHVSQSIAHFALSIQASLHSHAISFSFSLYVLAPVALQQEMDRKALYAHHGIRAAVLSPASSYTQASFVRFCTLSSRCRGQTSWPLKPSTASRNA